MITVYPAGVHGPHDPGFGEGSKGLRDRIKYGWPLSAGGMPLVDVRDVAEYKSGHVPGAINIPQKKLERQLDKLLDANGVVLYCIYGKRTRLAEQTLIENDIPDVFHLEGGLMGWRQGGFEVRTGWKP